MAVYIPCLLGIVRLYSVRIIGFYRCLFVLNRWTLLRRFQGINGLRLPSFLGIVLTWSVVPFDHLLTTYWGRSFVYLS